MLNITEGIVKRAQKAVIYGPEGIGKSTLASAFPDPLFFDTEGGTSHLSVRRVKETTWEGLIQDILEVAQTSGICKTLVIDTADHAEMLAVDFVLRKYGQASVEDFGYGKGYTYVGEEFGRMLKALDKVIESGKHVVILAHAKMRKFEQPDEMGAYDRYEMKLTRQSAPLLKEWSDLVLFCNYETYIVKDENKVSKGQGGKRVIYTSHHPCWDAKNRHGLPEKVPLEYKSIAFIFDEPVKEQDPTPLDKIHELMEKDHVTEEQIQALVASKGHYPEETPISQYEEKFITGWLIKYWDKILPLIKDDQKNS